METDDSGEKKKYEKVHKQIWPEIIKIDIFTHNAMLQLQMPITVVTEAKKKKKRKQEKKIIRNHCANLRFEMNCFSAMNTFFTSILIQKTIIQVQSVSQE